MSNQIALNPHSFDENLFSSLEDVTGVEPEEISSEKVIEEPFDPRLIRVETKPFNIHLLLERIKYGELNLAPSFQRKGGIWKESAQSRLVESLLIRIPLPAFYLDATDDEKWQVVDGLQRLTALKRFVLDKELKLRGLEFLTDLHDKTFDELPRNFQRRIVEEQVTVYLIEKGTPPEVKFNIFRRINTGGLPLSAQEIRHALNQGPVTEYLAQLADSQEFKSATNYGIRDDRMADRECVLRYFAFLLTPYIDYKSKNFDSFLNDTMATLNAMSNQERHHLSCQFKRVMIAASNIFGERAFRKQYLDSTRLYPINKPLFESWSVNLAKLSEKELLLLEKCKEIIAGEFFNLMSNSEFENSISFSTGLVSNIHIRFNTIERLIQGVLHDLLTSPTKF